MSAFSEGRHHVVLGDTAGHVRVLDISAGIDTATDQSVKRSFCQETNLFCSAVLILRFSAQVAHWRAHELAVSSIDIVLLADRDPLLLTCSNDTRVSLWTTRGGLVGHFGVDVWRLDDPSTWKDPRGEKSCSPIPDRSDCSDEVCLVSMRRRHSDIPRSRIFCLKKKKTSVEWTIAKHLFWRWSSR